MSEHGNKVSARSGWFADVAGNEFDDEAIRGMWQPCVASRSGIYSSLDIWFKTELECQEFIRDEILGIGFYPGEEPSRTETGNQ